MEPWSGNMWREGVRAARPSPLPPSPVRRDPGYSQSIAERGGWRGGEGRGGEGRGAMERRRRADPASRQGQEIVPRKRVALSPKSPYMGNTAGAAPPEKKKDSF